MITVALSATIGAPQDRVWRALTALSERPAWDDRILGEVDLPSSPRRRGARRHEPSVAHALLGRSRAGEPPVRQTRWRYRLSGVPLVLREDIVHAQPPSKIECRISIGSLGFDQTLTLHPEDDETGPRTRVGMKVIARNSIAVIGEIVPRLDVQRLVIEYVDTTLRQVQKYCEADA